MSANTQNAAINSANLLMSIHQQFQMLRQSVNEYITQYMNANNSANYGTIWAAFPTALQNADGSLGTADGTPVITHPIDNRVASVAGISRAVSKTSLNNGVQTLIDFQAFLGNLPVATANRSINIDALVS